MTSRTTSWRYRALGALGVAVLVLTGCEKTADKGKTTDQFVASGFSKDEATCMTDAMWAKIPKKDLNALTDPAAPVSDEQKLIIGQAMVTCAKATLLQQMKDNFTSADSTITPDQADCIIGKLTDADLVQFVNDGNSPAVVAATTACTSGS